MRKVHVLPIALFVVLAACQKNAPPPAPPSVPPPAPVVAPPLPASPAPENESKTESPASPAAASPANPAPAKQEPAKPSKEPKKSGAVAPEKKVPAAAPEPAAVAEKTPATAVEVSDADFDAKVVQSRRPVLVYVMADWSAHSRMGLKVVDEIAAQYAGKMTVVKLNYKVAGKTIKKYDVQAVPTTLIFKKGKVEATNLGWESKADLTAFIDGNL